MIGPRWHILAIYGVIGLALLAIAAPFLWILTVSLKYQIDILMGTFPFNPVWVNFDRVLFGKSSDFLSNAWNSFVVASGSTLSCSHRGNARGLLPGLAPVVAVDQCDDPWLDADLSHDPADHTGRAVVSDLP